MKRQQLEHILRAAAAITGADRFVVVGSQAIDFLSALLRHNLADPNIIEERLTGTSRSEAGQQECVARLHRLMAS